MESTAARRVEIALVYDGVDITRWLSESLLSLSYSDNPSGQLDDLQITLEDSQQLWQGEWSPAVGDTVDARIRLINWNGDGRTVELPCGSFEVDTVEFSGPPDTVQIKALSLPVGSSVRGEQRSRAWENVRLQTLAADVAANAGLTLLYEIEDNPIYDRIEQTEQSDLSFLVDLATKEGAAIKVSGGNLVLFDEAVYEAADPVSVIGRTDVSSYSFNWSTLNAAFRACEIVYTKPGSEEPIKAVFVPPGAPETGPVLKINESVDSEAEALRLARLRLREQNKNFGRGSLSLPGNVGMAAGLTVELSGWHHFDGKYIIESAKHDVSGSGYSTDIEIRKVLGW
ncbi:late control protein [Paenibacillus sp. GYB004]|uniref:phage late control D family protein n=1 Tax=Paenibacillus sp. GYB004 TaxID=2994393 RepID=UPI002F964D48